MPALSSFLPIDRRQALAAAQDLPEQTRGASLIADLSGFTALAEALATALGPHRGAEEVTDLLNRIFAALVAAVHCYHGSVVNFAGDALTAWFDGDDGRRATASALAMQDAMHAFATVPLPGGQMARLRLKCAIAEGPVRRFLVGDPAYGLLDTLAGATLDWVLAAEHVAVPGEIVLAPRPATALAADCVLDTWRPGPAPLCDQADAPAAQFAVVRGLRAPVTPIRWPTLTEPLGSAQVQPWLPLAIRTRLAGGQSLFLAELRPAVPLFLNFAGIPYDADADAGARLDGFVRWVQGVLARYEAAVLALTIGDKGSYLHTAFGAPLAHADDAARAASAALELRSAPAACQGIRDLRIGISSGQVWAGAYGGPGRRTYDVQGDVVNLAARLMQAAPPGGILATEAVSKLAGPRYQWAAHPPVRAKGKTAAVPVAVLTGEARRTPGLLEPAYETPLVGRTDELAILAERLDHARHGRGQVVAVLGEAGIGKSRLVAAVIAQARAAGWTVAGGAAEAYGTSTPYLAWQAIWRALFGLDVEAPQAQQGAVLAGALDAAHPTWGAQAPLLNPLLGLALPDTPQTVVLEGAARKTALEALLVGYLRARGGHIGPPLPGGHGGPPLLIVLEDCHWLDPLSVDLLAAVGRASAALAMMVLVAARPAEGAASPLTALEGLAHFTPVPLAGLPPAGAARLVARRLAAAGVTGSVADRLTATLTERTDGNPFFLEELLNYLADRGIDARRPGAVAEVEWPASLQSLLLSRIDRLSESQKVTLKVASVIGRVFPVAWLWGVYPDLGAAANVQADLADLQRLDLTPLDSPAPNLTYLFKHQVTQEVAYGSLPYELRAELHEQLAGWLEAGHMAPPAGLDLLAYHYGRSRNEDKQREYFRRAAEAAAAAYANSAAIDYYERLLPLLDAAGQGPVLLEIGMLLERLGQVAEAGTRYQQALARAESVAMPQVAARAWQGLGVVRRKQGNWAEAEANFEQARAAFAALGDHASVSRVLTDTGRIFTMRSEYARAHGLFEESLAVAREIEDRDQIANILTLLGRMARVQGQYAEAEAHYRASLDLRQAMGDRPGIATCLNGLGTLAAIRGALSEAQALFSEALAVWREMGDRGNQANLLNNLALVALDLEDYPTAERLLTETLELRRDFGEPGGMAHALQSLATAALFEGDRARARPWLVESLQVAHDIDYPELIGEGLILWALLLTDAPETARAGVVALVAGQRLLAELHVQLVPFLQRARDQAEAAGRATLAPPAFAAARAEGEATTWAAVLVGILDDPNPSSAKAVHQIWQPR